LCLDDYKYETDHRYASAIVVGKPEEVCEAGPTADDCDEEITYDGGWEQVEDPTAAGGTLSRTEAAGATASWTFTGTAVDVITASGTQHAMARGLVDWQGQATRT